MIRAGSKSRRTILGSAAAIVLLLTPGVGAQSRNFGWKVTTPRGATMYLIGSVHLLTKDFYPLNPAVEAAYRESELVVEEVDYAEMMQPMAQMQFLMRGRLPASTPLDSILSAPTMAMLTKRVADLGLPIEVVRQLKPWMIAVTLEAMEWQKAGFDQDLGLDKHFYDQAQRDGKTVQGLETVEYQISRFDDIPMDLQGHLLEETLKDIDNERANMSKLIEAWRTGDALTVERVVLKDLKTEPVLYQRLLVERNRNWLPKLDAHLAASKRAFVVVGAAHLVGPDGLVAMLKAKGYKVEQL